VRDHQRDSRVIDPTLESRDPLPRLQQISKQVRPAARRFSPSKDKRLAARALRQWPPE
jgi:hypothetical protein